MDPKLALELFGYLGTALVLLSFLMRDIKWLRAINMAGGFISLIYALCVNTMPVVVLNASLITINAFQLAGLIINEKKKKQSNYSCEKAYNQEEKETEDKI